MKLNRKVIAVMLAICLLLAMTPSVFAAGEGGLYDSVASQAYRVYAASGTCGDNLKWEQDDNGVLTISGTGPMYDYNYGGPHGSRGPWSQYVRSVIIQPGATSIGERAFYYCFCLTDVEIPDSVTSIGGLAFSSCSALKDIKIPDGVTSIGDYAFRDSGIEKYEVSEGNACFTSDADGVLYTKDYSRLISYPDSKSYSYKINWNTTTIDAYAFQYNYYLKDITIPEGMVSIGKYAFASCSGLRTIRIPNSAISIEEHAFYNCYNLDGVILPENVTNIGQSAFASCNSMEKIEIPVSLTSIESSAFAYCRSLTDVYYPGDEAQWEQISVGSDNDYLLNATIHFGENMDGKTIQDDFSAATRYVPYAVAVSVVRADSSFKVTEGSLPTGLSMDDYGMIEGIPTELGTYNFTVTETGSDGNAKHICALSVYSQTSTDVEKNNTPGYGFVETPTDNGRIQDQHVSSVSELTDQTMHCEGAYSEFWGLYLDAKLLVRDKDYFASEGSTKITITAETIGDAGGGTHTVVAEFRASDGKKHYTIQNYTVTGIAGKEVVIKIKSAVITWTDAEPYINTDDRTMTPFRAVGEALGLTAGWDSTTREASFSNGSTTVYFPINGNVARTSDGSSVTMDTSAVIMNGQTYVPIRFLAESFGLKVGWDQTTRTVSVD